MTDQPTLTCTHPERKKCHSKQPRLLISLFWSINTWKVLTKQLLVLETATIPPESWVSLSPERFKILDSSDNRQLSICFLCKGTELLKAPFIKLNWNIKACRSWKAKIKIKTLTLNSKKTKGTADMNIFLIYCIVCKQSVSKSLIDRKKNQVQFSHTDLSTCLWSKVCCPEALHRLTPKAANIFTLGDSNKYFSSCGMSFVCWVCLSTVLLCVRRHVCVEVLLRWEVNWANPKD